ncbi:LPXTG cell wall anchor domain-containing protein [Lactobacillus amylovorus]|nr:GbpC/Spa domain-containing protein [Lactobacillus amylovorus]MDB6251833.1 LPXTG cell wall anchor domain-containing protein [Lactobacillus amylovorus]MDB6266307.1 LPXTG cell wall anchor domain-containing protein [Lactobacillus amylovorus]
MSDKQDEGTGTDSKGWGKTYTGVQLKLGESVVARYTGLENSVYIDNAGATHKLSKVQVKYTLNSTTASDKTANIFLSNSPNIALWYGAAGNSNGSVDLTVDLTFYDENENPITMGKGSNAWLDMSSLNNGSTKVEYFAPNGNTTKQIPGSTIFEHNDGHKDVWYADHNNESDSADWDNPTSANCYKAATIMELEGKPFHIGQKITRNNVYSWFALDSSLATAYKPVEPKAPEKPYIAWHRVTYEPQKATVTYIDDTDKKTLHSDSLEGDSKADSKYNTKSSIEDYENKGYEFVSDDTNGQNVVFDNDSNNDQSYEVHLKHGTVTVTPKDKNPVKPGDKINPNDPNSPKYQDDVKHDNLAKDAKQTVHYEGAGIDTPADSVTTRKDAFTRTVTYDKVTGKSTTSGWSKPKTTFDKVDTPVVKGYTADKKQAGGLTATPDHPEVKDTVVYTPNGSIVPVDPNGNPIPGTHPVPYETDPTKVVDGKVPEVLGWTPKNGKPGDPVTPKDPTKDTEVSYDHTMTPGETTATGKVEGLPEKPAKSAKAPAEKLVKTPVKAPKAVKEAAPAEMPAQRAAQAQDQLPQTGEDNSKAAFGLGLASILGGIGILGAFKRKKKEN